MSTVVQNLKIEDLTREQKLRLIDELWESLDHEERPATLTPTQMQDLRDRIEYRRQHPEEGLTWEEVRARLADRL